MKYTHQENLTNAQNSQKYYEENKAEKFKIQSQVDMGPAGQAAQVERIETQQQKDERQGVKPCPIDTKQILQAVAEKQLEEKRQTGMMIQIISHENGNRSEPFIANFKELGEILNKEMETGESHIHEKDFLLLVAIFQGEETKIPTSPIITIETFLKLEKI